MATASASWTAPWSASTGSAATCTLPADTKRTVGRWLLEWRAGKIERGEIKPTTARGYNDHICNYLIPTLGYKKLAELRGIDLTRTYQAIVDERRAQIEAAEATNASSSKKRSGSTPRAGRRGRSAWSRPGGAPCRGRSAPASIARTHAVVSGALDDAAPDLVPRNVAKDAKRPKVKKKKVRPPVPEQYGAFLDEVEHDRLFLLWLLAGYSGLRRGELAGLKWEDVNLTTGKVVVRRQRVSVGYQVYEQDTKTDAGQDRVVFLDADAFAAVSRTMCHASITVASDT